MSTYYEFRCPVCKKSGGHFSRQMWGWGNANVIENHKFVMKHVAECNAESFDILSEHHADYGESEDMTYTASDYWPHSDDWDLVASVEEGEDWRVKWKEKNVGVEK